MTDGLGVRGVVLAGGDSTRFDDGDKALADLDGRPLLAHVVDAVDAATDGRPILAVADEREAERLRRALDESSGVDASLSVDTVTDVPDRSGPLAGLFAAVDALGETDASWLFVCACDMPLVTPAAVESLRRVAGETLETRERARSLDAVVPVVDGRRQPLHALYRRGALDAVRDDLSENGSLVALLDALGAVRTPEDGDLDPPLARATTNVNTRADLAALRGDSERDDGERGD